MKTKVEKNSNTAQERAKRVAEKIWSAWQEIIKELNITVKAISTNTKISEPIIRKAINEKEATTPTQWAITNYLAKAAKDAEEDEMRQLAALNQEG